MTSINVLLFKSGDRFLDVSLQTPDSKVGTCTEIVIWIGRTLTYFIHCSDSYAMTIVIIHYYRLISDITSREQLKKSNMWWPL